jgi:hypothetical protein
VPLGELHRKMRGRNIAMAWAIVAFVVFVFVLTLFKLKGSVS